MKHSKWMFIAVVIIVLCLLYLPLRTASREERIQYVIGNVKEMGGRACSFNDHYISYLDFRDCDNMHDDMFESLVLQRYGTLLDLEFLDLSYTQITDLPLKEICEKHQKLKVLKLSHTNITDKSLEYIETLQCLIILDISNTKISDSGKVRVKQKILENYIENYQQKRIE